MEAYLGLSGGAAPWIGLAGPRANLKVSGSVSDGAIRIQNLRLVGGAASLTASGTAVRDTAGGSLASIKDLQARWQLEVADLARFSSNLAGDLKATGQVKGTLKSMTASADLSSRLSVRGSAAGPLEASVRLSGLPYAPAGSIQAHGTLDGAPLDLDAAMDRGAAGTFRLLVRHAQWKSANANGDVASDSQLTQSRGQLHLDVEQLGDFSRLLGADVAGSVHGSLGFVPSDGHTKANLELDGANLAIGPLAGNVQIKGSGVSDWLDLQLTAQLPKFYGWPAGVSAAATLNLDARELAIASISADYRSQNFRLMAPAVLSFAQGISIDHAQIGAQEAVFDLAGQIAPSLDLRASLTHVTPGLFNVFMPGTRSPPARWWRRPGSAGQPGESDRERHARCRGRALRRRSGGRAARPHRAGAGAAGGRHRHRHGRAERRTHLATHYGGQGPAQRQRSLGSRHARKTGRRASESAARGAGHARHRGPSPSTRP